MILPLLVQWCSLFTGPQLALLFPDCSDTALSHAAAQHCPGAALGRLERKETCPICDTPMSFEELLG